MKPGMAPLYVKTYDLILDLLARCDKFPRAHRPVLGARIQDAGFTLLDAITLALTFRHGRTEHLIRADESIVRLRLALRLAGDREVMGAREQRFVMERLEEVGRMLGGWRRSLGKGAREGARECAQGGSIHTDALDTRRNAPVGLQNSDLSPKGAAKS